jgi:hypothetical protein
MSVDGATLPRHDWMSRLERKPVRSPGESREKVHLELLAIFWPLVVAPAALPMLVRPAGRLTPVLFGPVFTSGIAAAMSLGGPDSPGLPIPLVGPCISVAAVLAEAGARGGSRPSGGEAVIAPTTASGRVSLLTGA